MNLYDIFLVATEEKMSLREFRVTYLKIIRKNMYNTGFDDCLPEQYERNVLFDHGKRFRARRPANGRSTHGSAHAALAGPGENFLNHLR